MSAAAPSPAEPAGSAVAATASEGRAAAPSRSGRWLGHLLLALLLAAGAALRVLMQIGFRPAFAWPDSARYLDSARTLVPDTLRPSGYALFLRLIPHWRDLWPVTLVQHALGLAMAVLIYAFLRRRGVPGWGAALATAPLLLDPWQLTVEHDVLSDVLFEVLLLVACLLLTWRRRIGIAEALAAGALLGVATTVRSVGILLFVPVAIAVLLGQARWRPALATMAAFIVPIAGYTMWYASAHHTHSLSDAQYKQLYGRVATFVHCPGLTLPGNEADLCPSNPVGKRAGPGYFVWSKNSPVNNYQPPPGETLNHAVRDFDLRAITHQPRAYATTVAHDFLRGFGYDRFKETYPVMHPIVVPAVQRTYGVTAHEDTAVTGFLRSYGRHVAFPGPLLAAMLAIAIAAVCGAGRARRSGLRSAVGLLAGALTAVLLLAVAAAQFSWRYQLPQFVLLPPAAALGLVAMLRREPDPAALTGGQVTVRLTERLPLPSAMRELVAGQHRIRMSRYFAGSVICTIISAVTFMVAFGFDLLGSRGASLLSSATGAVAGYYLNRSWAWGRRGRADVRRELVPYWTTIVLTAIAAALVTGAVNHVVVGITDHRGVRMLFDTAAFLGTYLVSFVVKYVVFNRLFAGPGEAPADERAARDAGEGEAAATERVTGEPAAGEPVAGGTVAGGTVAGGPAAGGPAAGGAGAGEAAAGGRLGDRPAAGVDSRRS
ncbi:MAG: hypothetical protein ACJ74O_11105 [Frankiaceae bacterium]